jgi:hypothetical protein
MNEPIYPAPNSPAGLNASPVSGQVGAPITGAVPNMAPMTPIAPDIPLNNPPMAANVPAQAAPPINPLIQQVQPVASVSQPVVSVASGMANPLPHAAAPPANSMDDDTVQDDALWVNRAKRIIAQTQNDPHRQVQLLQQLSVVFLKERYGRSVHTDDA